MSARIKLSMLSEMLAIPHTKIRRWAKEFLPPDPKATLRSGFAREVSLNEGFKIYLGGHLVSHLTFSVIDARKIISDIRPWMLSKGLYPELPDYTPTEVDRKIEGYELAVTKVGEGEFLFCVKGRVRSRQIQEDGMNLIEEVYATEFFHSPKQVMSLDFHDPLSRRLLISDLLRQFNRLVVSWCEEKQSLELG
jgi:hypothetical protein